MVKRSDAFPKNWMTASDLGGKPDVVTIKTVTFEPIKGLDGKEKQKVVVYVARKYKPLILNVTNFDSIAAIAGSNDTDDWPGLKIEYVPSTVPFNGQIKDCVRIRKPETVAKAKSKKSADDPKPDYDDEIPH
jgi:hypothetical protein